MIQRAPRIFRAAARMGTAALLAASLLPVTALAGSRPSPTSVAGIPLAGTRVPDLGRARRLGRLSPTRQMTVTVTLRVRNLTALQTFLAAVYDPGSSLYHHFLTPVQFAARYAPSPAARREVASWLQSQGLRVVGVSANGMQIRARGTVTRIQRSFGTQLFTYRLGARTFFANAGAAAVPAGIASSIVSISGLTNSAPEEPAPGLLQASLQSYSPADLAAIYDVAPLRAAGDTGAGQTIGIATFAGYSPGDVSTFDKRYGLSNAISRVSVDGTARTGAANGQNETEADIETTEGMAPGAKVIVYEAPNEQSNQSAIDLYNRIVTDDKAQIVTTSWGSPEDQIPDSDLYAFHQILQEAAAQGQAWFAASGDSGAYDDSSVDSNNTALSVDYPASDPYVTGVGGTSLDANGTAYQSESAWSISSSNQGPAGSGGGLSGAFARPSWQTGPGVDNQYTNGRRQMPDVSADADPNTGLLLYTVLSRHGTGWTVGGGTSISAPLWAGFAAIVNQAVGHRLGFLNPTVYLLGQHASSLSPSPFHDVTTGDNLYYPATAGWDFATGWGSMDGVGFVNGVRALGGSTSTPTPAPTPSVTIRKVLLLHKVNGKLAATSSLKLGETGQLIVRYLAGGSNRVTGKVSLRENGQVIKTVTLTHGTYQGNPVMEANLRFTSKNRVGTLTSHVTLSLVSVTAMANKVLKIRP
ncbi:MAG TPA: S53 family peptidase [Chloroflexota bacterium]|nr:S53 family peptidase [Chloroflexota bacterium]